MQGRQQRQESLLPSQEERGLPEGRGHQDCGPSPASGSARVHAQEQHKVTADANSPPWGSSVSAQ